MNTIALTGRLGQNPEIKYFESGTSLCKVSIAVDNQKNKDNPSWFSLELWGKTAEVCTNYTRKGSLIGVEGELRLESWTDPNGTLRTKTVVRVQNLHLLEKKAETTQAQVPAVQQNQMQALANF